MASGTLLTEQDMKRFHAEYGELIRQQCTLLMGETKEAKDLEELVYQSIREKYEYQPLPEHCETMLIARCCILSSELESPDTLEKTAPWAETPAVQPAKAPETPVRKTSSDPVPETPKVLKAITESAPAAARETESIPDEIKSIRITAAYDPEKTELWLPGGLQPDRIHLQKDPEDPEEITAERSVTHSIFNTFLVIFFLGGIGFFMWKTGLLHLLSRVLEGIFIYG